MANSSLCLGVWPDRDRFWKWQVAPLPSTQMRPPKGDSDHGDSNSRHSSSGLSNSRQCHITDAERTGMPRPRRSSAPSACPTLHRALRLGWEDFKAVPSHAIILCVIYPVLGLVLARTVHRLFGIAAVVSARRRLCPARPVCSTRPVRIEPAPRARRADPSAWDAFEVLRSPSFGAMLGLGALLLALFVVWIATAQAIYVAAFGYEVPRSFRLCDARADDVAGLVADRRRLRRRFPVRAGRALHQRGVLPADARSSCQRRGSHGDLDPRGGRNPMPMAAWGLIVAVLLVGDRCRSSSALAIVVPAARPRHLASLPGGD